MEEKATARDRAVDWELEAAGDRAAAAWAVFKLRALSVCVYVRNADIGKSTNGAFPACRSSARSAAQL